VLISPPPPQGLRFDKLDFRDQVKATIEDQQPGVILIDPWNAVARDDKQKDYRETFDLVREVVPAGDFSPAIGIAAHTRKPQANERANGRSLLNLLAGSYILASVPRCIWVLQHASDAVDETRVVVTCCKNNDGELGNRSVWTRDNGLWTPVQDFDWTAWDNGEKEQDFTCENVTEILSKNSKGLSQSKLASEIVKRGASRATAYRRILKAEKTGEMQCARSHRARFHPVADHRTLPGLVVSIATSPFGTAFINFGRDYPNQTFAGFISAESTLANDRRLTMLQGKIIDIIGTIVLYEGKPEIKVVSADQIRILAPRPVQ
jgi:hypothetical protein